MDKDTIEIIVYSIIIVICIAVIIYLLKFRNKNRLNKIDKTDLSIVKKFTEENEFEKLLQNNKKIGENEEFYNIYDEFKMYEHVRRCFCDGEPILGIEKKEIPNIEIKELIKRNKSLYKLYVKEMKMIDIVFKYYDEKGVWKKV